MCTRVIIPSTWWLSPHTVFLDGHHRIIWSPLHCPTSISSDREWRKWVRLAEKLNGVIFNRFYSFPPREKPRSKKVQKPRTFNCLFIQHYPRYCSSSSWFNWSAIQPRHIIQHKLHLSRVVSLFLAQTITFGSNDHFQGAGPALPTGRFFFFPSSMGE